MSFPPPIMRLRIQEDDRSFSLWLPLILIWPLIVVLGIALLPVVLILAILLWPTGWGKTILFGGPALLRVCCALRGLEIYVEETSQQVFISFR